MTKMEDWSGALGTLGQKQGENLIKTCPHRRKSGIRQASPRKPCTGGPGPGGSS